ncbi:MAG: hypothetical protein AAFX58_06270 [Pseudomonadota bacterium]
MSGLVEYPDTGITVAELPRRDQPIAANGDCVLAFVGRTLRGPVNEPVEIDGMAAFQRHFGAPWEGSLLGPAVEQYFSHGGRRAVVVRVANGARRARLVLPGDGGELTLEACHPGAAEVLRVAVDYDGIAGADPVRFNLTAQRLAGPGGRITDQEIHGDVSVAAADNRFITDILAGSQIVRVAGDVPPVRPAVTADCNAGKRHAGYRLIGDAGSDGAPLTDYDLIGSQREATGLFALAAAECFDVLYAPPASFASSPGPAYVLAAERYCRERGALLLVDPPATLEPAERRLPLRSAHIVAYYPRVVVRRRRADGLTPVGGALAGLLACGAAGAGPAFAFSDARRRLSRSYTLPNGVGGIECHSLRRQGFNPLTATPAGRLALADECTASGGAQDGPVTLAAMRLSLVIRRAVVDGTRWAAFEPGGEDVWRRIEAQVAQFLDEVAAAGWFGRDAAASWFVHCDATTNRRVGDDDNALHFLVGFVPAGQSEPVVLAVTQRPDGAECRPAAFVRDVAGA